MHHDPLTADGREAIAGYTPVQLAARTNGWTADRQRIFLAALAETGSVSVACKAAGITARSAYRLRADPRGAPFAAAWHRALYVATNAMVALAFERATRGSYREYWKNGELVAETRQPSDTMLKFLLTRLMPSMFNCKPEENWSAAYYAQQHFPDLLDKLTDSDVRADRLSAADFEPQPREAGIEPPIPPGEENDSWHEDIDRGPDRWGGQAAAADGHGPEDDGLEPDSYPPATLEQRAAAYRLDDLDEEDLDGDDDFDEKDQEDEEGEDDFGEDALGDDDGDLSDDSGDGDQDEEGGDPDPHDRPRARTRRTATRVTLRADSAGRDDAGGAAQGPDPAALSRNRHCDSLARANAASRSNGGKYPCA